MEYRVTAHRVDADGSLARTKDSEILLDTDVSGGRDAFNPAELFLATVAACMINGVERISRWIKVAEGQLVAIENGEGCPAWTNPRIADVR